MDSSDFEPCLGKTDDAPEVVQLLSTLGVTKKLKPPKGGEDLTVELKKAGVVLVFGPHDVKSSKMKLIEVQFYSDAEEGYKTFAGKLPGGLTFTDKQDDARRKLGKPARSKKEFRYDAWKAGPLELIATFSKKDGRIEQVQLGLPL
ncbi:MAG TPA: hypothetical protein VH374_13335 [Polyangia bacterium]|jgi:hypothetical protein|nr:hypothetical protein [Polyangia bacterium]